MPISLIKFINYSIIVNIFVIEIIISSCSIYITYIFSFNRCFYDTNSSKYKGIIHFMAVIYMKKYFAFFFNPMSC